MDDCFDKSDETNCTQSHIEHIDDIPFPNLDCRDAHSFNCSLSKGCVPLSWKCDGAPDCPKGEDEDDCEDDLADTSRSRRPGWITPSHCNSDEMLCTSSGQCINITSVCNGVADCPGEEDEVHCRCSDDEPFDCGDGIGAPLCIPESWVCDHEK